MLAIISDPNKAIDIRDWSIWGGDQLERFYCIYVDPRIYINLIYHKYIIYHKSSSASDKFTTPSGGEVGRGGATYQVWSLMEYNSHCFSSVSTNE